MTLNKQQVIIVGSGSFGISAALELCQRGWPGDVFVPGPISHRRLVSAKCRVWTTALMKIIFLMEQAEPYLAGTALA
ncbi:MAG TPA: FAD-dependent oxidoreductase [Anaerolineales bacterium]|nr:FAD-dependent oxidoreductase [Anaerolineales bacterium]